MSVLGKLAKVILKIKENLILLELKKPPCKIYLPDDSIWALIREIYLLEAYPPFESLKGVIIDAGAHAGSFAVPASFFADRVVAIEPNPIMVKLLEMNTLINRRRNIDILPYALYHSSKTVYFNPDDLTSVMGTVSKEGKIEVQAISLDEIVERYGEIELLKMDIEGAEYDVIFNARKESLRRIKRLVGEIHYEGKEMLEKFGEYLKEMGFKYKFVGKSEFYSPFRVLKAVKNSAKIKGQMFYKITNYIYLLTPIPKPITLMFSGKDRVSLFFAERI
ncbi:FkbM family methyltransferase [Candidatus Caldipriscus sp.]|nr:FkbM family methyltransferase [Candidatus Caldipriscus sp.]